MQYEGERSGGKGVELGEGNVMEVNRMEFFREEKLLMLDRVEKCVTIKIFLGVVIGVLLLILEKLFLVEW